MDMDIGYAVLFGLVAMVGSGLSNVFSRVPTRVIGSDRALFWRQVILVAFQVPLVIALFPRETTALGLLEALAVGAFGYLPVRFFFMAVERGRVGVVTPISNASAVITSLLAIAVLGEPFGLPRVLGLMTAFAGVALISVEFRDWRNSALFRKESGIPFAAAACLLWGVILFLIRYPVLLIGPILTSFIVEVTVLVVSAIRLHVTREPFGLPKEVRLAAVGVGFFSVLSSVGYDAGLLTSAVAAVAVINMTNPVIAAAYERLVYRESLTFRQYAGMALAIAGAAMVSVL